MQNLFCRSCLCSRSCFLSGGCLCSGCCFLSRSLSLCGRSFLSLFILLVDNSLDYAGEGCDGRIQCGADRGHENVVGREICELVDSVEVNDLTVEITTLDLETLVGLCKVLGDTCSSCMVLLGGCKSCGTSENVLELIKANLLCCSLKESVLDNGVVNTGFTEFSTKSCIVSYADTAVFNKDTGDGVVELINDFSNSLLFLFEYFFARQTIHLPKINALPVSAGRA